MDPPGPDLTKAPAFSVSFLCLQLASRRAMEARMLLVYLCLLFAGFCCKEWQKVFFRG